jgi:hypothetical protein
VSICLRSARGHDYLPTALGCCRTAPHLTEVPRECRNRRWVCCDRDFVVLIAGCGNRPVARPGVEHAVVAQHRILVHQFSPVLHFRVDARLAGKQRRNGAITPQLLLVLFPVAVDAHQNAALGRPAQCFCDPVIREGIPRYVDRPMRVLDQREIDILEVRAGEK